MVVLYLAVHLERQKTHVSLSKPGERQGQH